eukprot:Sspe_Gene.111775::Locus_93900_Transcript_1_1_Confidence_1.000_Length_719::g.111775::m.111775
MSEEDKEYLRKNNIHQLLDQLAKDIIEARPDNPQLFVVEWLKKKEEEEHKPNGGHPVSPKKPKMQINVPEAPQRLAPETLAEWQRKPGDVKYVVVDVRETTELGKIPGSLHIPFEDFTKEPSSYGEKWKDKDAIVFVSSQSPDLDQSAALPLLHDLLDRGSTAQVFVLLGGMVQWISEYRSDERLVTGFNEEVWKKSLARPDATP